MIYNDVFESLLAIQINELFSGLDLASSFFIIHMLHPVFSVYRIEPQRVIIKEGQRACNFYFILSGTVVITEWNDVIKASQTKCMLQRGMEFGVGFLCDFFDESCSWHDLQ